MSHLSLSAIFLREKIAAISLRPRLMFYFSDTHITEFFGGGWALLWGILLLLPAESFAVAPGGYATLRAVPHAHLIFGLIAVAVGASQVAAAFWGCMCKRRRAALLTSWWYAFLAASFLISHWALATAFNLAAAMVSGYVAWRLASRRGDCAGMSTEQRDVEYLPGTDLD